MVSTPIICYIKKNQKRLLPIHEEKAERYNLIVTKRKMASRADSLYQNLIEYILDFHNC